MTHQRAAHAAKNLLSRASRHLLTHDPSTTPGLSDAIDDSMDWSLSSKHDGGFHSSFSETRGNALGFQIAPGHGQFSTQDQGEVTTDAVRKVIGANMGADAEHWFDARTEPFRGRSGALIGEFGASFSTAVDNQGLVEAAATYGWSPDLTSHFPQTIIQMVNIAKSSLTSLEPFFTTIRCGRSAGGQQVSFEITEDVTLMQLKSLMEAFGLGHRHGGLMTLAAFVLGANYRLSAHSSVITLLRAGANIEFRLDVNVDALAEAPKVLLPLLRLPLAERPQELANLDRWLTAFTPDGYNGPGSVTVLSIRVRPDMPARLALFLRPIAFEQNEEDSTRIRQEALAGEIQAAQMPVWRNLQ